MCMRSTGELLTKGPAVTSGHNVLYPTILAVDEERAWKVFEKDMLQCRYHYSKMAKLLLTGPDCSGWISNFACQEFAIPNPFGFAYLLCLLFLLARFLLAWQHRPLDVDPGANHAFENGWGPQLWISNSRSCQRRHSLQRWVWHHFGRVLPHSTAPDAGPLFQIRGL
jgi:hypothetical protein